MCVVGEVVAVDVRGWRTKANDTFGNGSIGSRRRSAKAVERNFWECVVRGGCSGRAVKSRMNVEDRVGAYWSRNYAELSIFVIF